jgi:trehalose 6-phosphate synthase
MVRTIQHGHQSYVLTDLAEEDYQEYYNGYANRMLWPILHCRLDLAEFSLRDLSGYMRVNQRFAAELNKVLQPDDIVWVHDYHLMPLAKELRNAGHRNRIGFFHHIPFPPPEILTALPNHEHLIPAMGHYDLIGFQTEIDAENFARYLRKECGMPADSSPPIRYRLPKGSCREMLGRALLSMSRTGSSFQILKKLMKCWMTLSGTSS